MQTVLFLVLFAFNYKTHVIFSHKFKIHKATTEQAGETAKGFRG